MTRDEMKEPTFTIAKSDPLTSDLVLSVTVHEMRSSGVASPLFVSFYTPAGEERADRAWRLFVLVRWWKGGWGGGCAGGVGVLMLFLQCCNIARARTYMPLPPPPLF